MLMCSVTRRPWTNPEPVGRLGRGWQVSPWPTVVHWPAVNGSNLSQSQSFHLHTAARTHKPTITHQPKQWQQVAIRHFTVIPLRATDCRRRRPGLKIHKRRRRRSNKETRRSMRLVVNSTDGYKRNTDGWECKKKQWRDEDGCSCQ